MCLAMVSGGADRLPGKQDSALALVVSEKSQRAKQPAQECMPPGQVGFNAQTPTDRKQSNYIIETQTCSGYLTQGALINQQSF